MDKEGSPRTPFMSEEEIYTEFGQDLKEKLDERWYAPEKKEHGHKFTYGHKQRIAPENHYDCNLLVDEWYKWFLTSPVSPSSDTGRVGWYADRNPYGDRNVFSLNKRNTFAYFIATAPFQHPGDVKRAVITRRAPLLVPLYNVSAAREECPSYDDSKLVELIKKDLKGTKQGSVKVEFDDMDKEDLFGCTVSRLNGPLEVSNIPDENVLGIPKERLQECNYTIHVFHAGFWLLIDEKNWESGDHLLSFEAKSKNYEMSAKIVISVLI
ncbi:hypothetical protein BH18THE2_BH18THE2_24610 [soil metagenome]